MYQVTLHFEGSAKRMESKKVIESERERERVALYKHNLCLCLCFLTVKLAWYDGPEGGLIDGGYGPMGIQTSHQSRSDARCTDCVMRCMSV